MNNELKCIIDEFGEKEWYLNGQLHREDGPAVEWRDGSKEWYLNGQRHREDGPAIELSNLYKAWYIKDKLHRLDGPAREYLEGQEWWVNGVLIKREWYKKS